MLCLVVYSRWYRQQVLEQAAIVLGLGPVTARGGGEGQHRAAPAVAAAAEHRHSLLQKRRHVERPQPVHPAACNTRHDSNKLAG